MPSETPVESVNAVSERCYTLKMTMPSVSTANRSACVQRCLVDQVGWSILQVIFDYWKFFHQFVYAAYQRWFLNRLAPYDEAEPRRLATVNDERLIMGEHSSAKYAQRAVDSTHAEFMKHFMRRVRELLWHRIPKRLQQLLDQRDQLIPHDECGSHGTLLDIQCFMDDPCCQIMDDPETGDISLLFFRELFAFIGPAGVNIKFAEWAKWNVGTDAKWLSVIRAPALGVAWLSPAKVTVTRQLIADARAGNSAEARGSGKGVTAKMFQRMHGLFMSLIEGCGVNRSACFHMSGPLRKGGELERGDDTLVEIEAHPFLDDQLAAWSRRLLNFPGASMLAAVKALPPARSTARVRARVDAAVAGTPTPGLGGSLLSLWWRFALTGALLDMPIAWHEPIAYGVELIVFREEMEQAERIIGVADATVTRRIVASGARGDATQFIAAGLDELTIRSEVAVKLEHDQGFGAGNDVADFASRGYISSILQIGAQMGLNMQERQLGQEALEYLAYTYGGLLSIAGRSPKELPEPLLSTWNTHAQRRPAAQSSTGSKGKAALLIAALAAQAAANNIVEPSPRVAPALQGLDVSPACSAHDGMHRSHRQSQLAAPIAGAELAAEGRSCFRVLQQARAHSIEASSAGYCALADAHSAHSLLAPPVKRAAPELAAPSPRPPPLREIQSNANLALVLYATERERRPTQLAAAITPAPSACLARDTTQRWPQAQRSQAARGAYAGDTGSATASATQRSSSSQSGTALQTATHDTLTGASAQAVSARAHSSGQGAARSDGRSAIAMRAENLAERLAGISSRYAINVDREELQAMCYFTVGGARERDECDDAAKGFNSTAWRYWVRYCNSKNTTPWRDNHAANAGLDTTGYDNEVVLWSNALPEILGFMGSRCGWDTPPRPASALKHLRTVRALHCNVGITPISLRPATAKCVAMMKQYLIDNGVEALLPHQKEPFTNAMLASMLACSGPTRKSGRAQVPWDWQSFEGAAWNAFVHTAAQTGMRNEEFTSPPGGFSKRDLSLANLTWHFNGARCPYLSETQLRQLSDGDFAILTPAASKCDPFGMRWGAKPIWLPFSSSAWLCAARALRDLELRRLHVAPEERRKVPLFCHESGIPWARSYTFDLLRLFVRCIGTPEERVKDYTPHSFRIYLCNALAAQGLEDKEIQTALRWASVDALNTYHLTDAATYTRWLNAAMGARFTVSCSTRIQLYSVVFSCIHF